MAKKKKKSPFDQAASILAGAGHSAGYEARLARSVAALLKAEGKLKDTRSVLTGRKTTKKVVKAAKTQAKVAEGREKFIKSKPATKAAKTSSTMKRHAAKKAHKKRMAKKKK